jgi:hypothetical protein
MKTKYDKKQMTFNKAFNTIIKQSHRTPNLVPELYEAFKDAENKKVLITDIFTLHHYWNNREAITIARDINRNTTNLLYTNRYTATRWNMFFNSFNRLRWKRKSLAAKLKRKHRPPSTLFWDLFDFTTLLIPGQYTLEQYMAGIASYNDWFPYVIDAREYGQHQIEWRDGKEKIWIRRRPYDQGMDIFYLLGDEEIDYFKSSHKF